MIIQAALFLLVAIVVLGVAGKWIRPTRPREKPRSQVESAERCAVCGDYVLGRADACQRENCPNR